MMKVLSQVPNKTPLQVGYASIDDRKRKSRCTVSSILEVYPATDAAFSETKEKPLKGTWNKDMSQREKVMSETKKVTAEDERNMKRLFYEFIQFENFMKSLLFQVLSDTGLVALSKDCKKLIATDDIEMGVQITHLPYTRKPVLLDDEHLPVYVEGIRGTIIKKFAPFVGFGGFATWSFDEKTTNCCIRKKSANSLVLVSTREIGEGEQIVCLVAPDHASNQYGLLVNDNIKTLLDSL